MVAVLQTATSATPDRRLPGVLGDFRRQWAAIAHHRYPSLGSDLDDALQESLVKLTDGQRLATLRDPQQIESWARSLFVHTVLDVLKAEVLHTRGRATSDAAEALIERLPSAAPSTEDLVAAP